jgi:beta-lactamase superfamily II metal-dependent hydrolase
MTIQYISTKSTVLHPDSQTDSQEFVLIFGDEINTTGRQQNGRDEVIYRGRIGWVRSDRLMPNHPLEMYCIDVGQGDSFFTVTPAGRKILIDGGRGNEAFQFLAWKYRLDLPNPALVTIDLMVVSHTDDDHIAGLISILAHPLIEVREIIHSGIAKYNSGFNTELGDTVGQGQNRILVTRHNGIADLDGEDVKSIIALWVNTVNAEPNLIYRAVDSTTGVIDVGDPAVTLHVLGPILTNNPNHPDGVYPWFGTVGRTVNGHSVLLRLDYQNIRVLLPGDINDRGASYLMADPNFPTEADAHVLKAPHHGSHDFNRSFLEAVHPQISLISSGESPDHGHPRANFLGTIGNVSRSNEPLLFSTELIAQFAVDSDAEAPDADNDVDPTDPAMIGQARRRFKKRLNGIINVRTDGNDLYCARRVAAGYQFVTYKQVVAPRNQ